MNGLVSLALALLLGQAPDLTDAPSLEEEALPESLPAPIENTAPAEQPPSSFQDPFAAPAPEAVQEVPPLPNNGEAPAAPAPTLSPDPNATIAPPAEPAFEDQPKPKDDFAFPENMEEERGPVSQDVVRSELLEQQTQPGTWHMGATLGGGMNVNNRRNQIHFQIDGGYRYSHHSEFGGIISYRFIKDKLLGFIGTYDYVWRMTNPPTTRIDVRAGGGLGWTLQAVSGSFTQGLFTLRLHGEALFYIWPTMALSSAAALEMFPFGFTTDGKAKNLLGGNGLPTQLMLGLGIRYEF